MRLILKWISRFTWEIIQTTVGAIWFVIVRLTDSRAHTYVEGPCFVTGSSKYSGVSLGAFIFHADQSLYAKYNYPNPTIEVILTTLHEYGHSRQSLYLGPLYFIVIGIPSLFFNILTRLKILPHNTYYTRFPENWADQLGGVRR